MPRRTATPSTTSPRPARREDLVQVVRSVRGAVEPVVTGEVRGRGVERRARASGVSGTCRGRRSRAPAREARPRASGRARRGSAVACRAGGQQLVPEHEDVDGGAPHGDDVRPAAGDAGHRGRGQPRARTAARVPVPATPAPPGGRPARSPPRGDATSPRRQEPVLATEHAVRARRQPRPGGDRHGVPGASGGGTAPASTCPRTRHGPGPATAQPSIAAVSAGGGRSGEHVGRRARRRCRSSGSWHGATGAGPGRQLAGVPATSVALTTCCLPRLSARASAAGGTARRPRPPARRGRRGQLARPGGSKEPRHPFRLVLGVGAVQRLDLPPARGEAAAPGATAAAPGPAPTRAPRSNTDRNTAKFSEIRRDAELPAPPRTADDHELHGAVLALPGAAHEVEREPVRPPRHEGQQRREPPCASRRAATTSSGSPGRRAGRAPSRSRARRRRRAAPRPSRAASRAPPAACRAGARTSTV